MLAAASLPEEWQRARRCAASAAASAAGDCAVLAGGAGALDSVGSVLALDGRGAFQTVGAGHGHLAAREGRINGSSAWQRLHFSRRGQLSFTHSGHSQFSS